MPPGSSSSPRVPRARAAAAACGSRLEAAMDLTLALGSVAGLLVLAPLAIATSRTAWSQAFIYGCSLVISTVALVVALQALLGAAGAQTATLPLGLPWLGAHFRLDALSAFFLLIVN